MNTNAPPSAAPSSAGAGLPNPTGASLPLAGLRVVEFTHMVMGPTCGMVLADMGAEVIKVEPIEGDRTRHLLGAGAGFFPMFNRNKKSIALDLHTPAGAEVARKLAASADVVAENFKPGTMGKYGLDYASSQGQPAPDLRQPQGFPARPLRASRGARRSGADDGRPGLHDRASGDPLRAGTSVNDIMGGMFGAMGALGALIQRGITGRGQEVQSALFENNVFLVGQHMMQFAITGKPAAPMPERISAWAVYDVFTVKDGEQIFLAAVSDAQWATFCDALGFADLKADARYATNNQRVTLRPALMPRPARAPGRLQRGRTRRDLREGRPAVCADPQARGTVRRRAPERHRRPGRRHPARWRARRPDRPDHAVSLHDGRPAPGRAPAAADDG